MRILIIFGGCLFGMFLHAQNFFEEHFSSEEKAVQIVTGQILVQLQPNISAIQFSEYFKQENPFVKFETVEQLALSWNIWLFETEAGHEQEVLLQVRKMKNVIAAQLNHYAAPRSVTPNDPYFFQQWNLLNTGQGNGTPGADIKATKAWNLTTGGKSAQGDTIVIAVIDDGFDLIHSDMQFKKNHQEIPGNGIDDDGNGYIDDYDGWNAFNNTGNITSAFHGMHVAGIAGAKGNNNSGVAGVNWNVHILPVVIKNYTDAEVTRAYAYVFEQRKIYNLSNGAAGALIVATNSSFGVNFANPADYPLWCGMYDSLGNIGILNAIAPPNTFADIDVRGDVPTACASDFIIAVSNSNINDILVSAFGVTTVDLTAPGSAIYSTYPGNTYGARTGTSMASPHVAGVVSLLLAAACDSFMTAYKNNPAQVALEVKNFILNGVDKIPSHANKTVSGGRLNAFRSILFMKQQYCVDCILDIQFQTQNTTCSNSNDGEIITSITNGTPPYIFDWSDNSDTLSPSELNAGNYFLLVIDSNNCMGIAATEIMSAPPIMLNFTVQEANSGQFNGSATVGVIGGIPPYDIRWNDAAQTNGNSISGVLPGNYTVTVADANNCTRIETVTIGVLSNIEEKDFPDIRIFPNPALNSCIIEVAQNMKQTVAISISDVRGKILFSEENIQFQKYILSLENYAQGIYFIGIQSEKWKTVRKIVKE